MHPAMAVKLREAAVWAEALSRIRLIMPNAGLVNQALVWLEWRVLHANACVLV